MDLETKESMKHCDGNATDEFIKTEVQKSIAAGSSDSFWVTDLSRVIERYQQWQECFPTIRPFYAVKAQNNAPIRMLLKSLGSGFDCASLNEIRDVISSGVNPEDIIYAHPYKQVSHLKEALKLGLISVCDVPSEIFKVGKTAEELGVRPRVLIRIIPVLGETVDKFHMNAKFGAQYETVGEISKAAKEARVDIVGVSFHVGSPCHSSKVYGDTLIMARRWWDALEEEGFSLSVLDIGGGFPGEGGELFKQYSRDINLFLQKSFGDIIMEGIRVIAEPGRFMVTSSQTLVTSVIASKGPRSFVLSTGVYGGLSNTIFEPDQARACKPYKINLGSIDEGVKQGHENGHVNGLRNGHTNGHENGYGKEKGLALWGPTCDGTDVLMPGYTIPDLETGDWVAFPNQGAYGSMTMSSFNGFDLPEIKFVKL